MAFVARDAARVRGGAGREPTRHLALPGSRSGGRVATLEGGFDGDVIPAGSRLLPLTGAFGRALVDRDPAWLA